MIPPFMKGYMTYQFVIEGIPVLQERPRKGMHGNFYDPSAKAKKALGWKLLEARRSARASILKGEVRLNVIFYGMSRGDADNALKALQDAGNGILWSDDRQIVEISCKLERQAERPRTEISITEVL